MSRGLAVLLGVGAGCLVGMQAPINSRSRPDRRQRAGRDDLVPRRHDRAAGDHLVRQRRAWQLSLARHAPPWALVGGLLGAVYVTVALVAVRTLGASGLTAVVITGQLAISVAIDRFGLLGVARQSIGVQRIVRARAARRRCRAGGAQVATVRATPKPRAKPLAPAGIPRRPAELALGQLVRGSLRAVIIITP